ncbi:MAG: hypothetical protein ACLGIK_10575, partial [Gemmatimonadota bacterium]
LTTDKIEDMMGQVRAYMAVYSDELDVRYDVALGDSVLVVRSRKIDEEKLTPAFRDAFTVGFGATLQFTRDRSGKVNGFAISDGRVRGVRFDRLR